MKIFLLVLCLAFAKAETEEISPFLTSTVLALFGEFPSAVFIRAPGVPLQPTCGGTVIDRSHILTSAQCVLNQQNQLINPFWYRAFAGDLNVVVPTSRRVVRSISRIFVHPNFNPTSRNNDLAVLRVSEPFPEFHNSIETAVLSNITFAPNTVCRLAAWGATTNAVNAPIQPDLRAMNSPILLTANCNAANVHANRVLNVHMCAGSLTVTGPQSGACQGNIGSGLYCNGLLAGVLSFGQSCGAANLPGVYIDVRQYSNWIQSQLLRTDNPQPGWMPVPN